LLAKGEFDDITLHPFSGDGQGRNGHPAAFEQEGPMRRIWTIQTRHALWAIAQSADGRWHPMFENEDLGSYHSPEQALEDLVGGHTFRPASGLDPSTCGLPAELADWSRQG
jgi:hypothetical protein